MRIYRHRFRRYFHNGMRISAAQAKELQAKGEHVEVRSYTGRRWWICVSIRGRRYYRAGLLNRRDTEELAVKWQRELERQAVGLDPSPEALAEALDIEEHLEFFEAELRRRDRTPKHVSLTIARIRRVFEEAGIKSLFHLDATRIADAIRRLPLSVESQNHHLVACKSLTRWLVRRAILPQDPLAQLSRWNAATDRRIVRRALDVEELDRLLRAARASKRVFRGLDGQTRAVLYLLAVSSGLRVSELASLTPQSFQLDANPAVVIVEASHSKHRRQDAIPLPPSVAEELRGWIAGRPAGSPLWPGTWKEKAAGMLADDLREAGIDPLDETGRKLDFHALRATYATLLARAGVNLQTSQALLRHSSPTLTSTVYTKLGVADLGSVVERLDSLLDRGKKQ